MMFESCILFDQTSSLGSLIDQNKDIWILGKLYSNQKSELEINIVSRYWFTYRKNFIQINDNPCLTSDAGWGCMIRSGQMLLAEALSRYVPLYVNFYTDQNVHQLEKTSKYEHNNKNPSFMLENAYESQLANSLAVNSANRISALYNNAKRYLTDIWYTNHSSFLSSLSISSPTASVNDCNCGDTVISSPLQQCLCSKKIMFDNNKSLEFVIQNYYKNLKNLKVLKYFLDDPKSPFSIHNISTSSLKHNSSSNVLQLSNTNDGQPSNTIDKDHCSSPACENFAVPGKWFGPNSVAQAMKYLINNDTSLNIVLHVAMDNTIILSEIDELFEDEGQKKLQKQTNSQTLPDDANNSVSLILIVPLRLGLSQIIPAYFEALKAFFRLPQSLGILGGKPKHASWFIGYADDDLICLDPHTVQKAMDLDTFEKGERAWISSIEKASPGENFEQNDNCSTVSDDAALQFSNFLQTFHCGFPDIRTNDNEKSSEIEKTQNGSQKNNSTSPEKEPKKTFSESLLNTVTKTTTASKVTKKGAEPCVLPFEMLDPSLSLGFFCQNYQDYKALCESLRENLIKPFSCPMFEILDKPLPLWDMSQSSSPKNASTISLNPDLDRGECEDFEVI